MYSQSPQTIPLEYDSVLEDENVLRQQQRTLPSSRPAVRDLWRQIRTITVRESLSSPLRALGTIGLGVGVFKLGMKIGDGLNAKLLHIGLPDIGPARPPTNYQLSFSAHGDGQVTSGQVALPNNVWVFSYSYGNQLWTHIVTDARVAQRPECQYTTPPTGMLVRTGSAGHCWADAQTSSYYLPEDGLDAAGPVEDYTGQPFDRSLPAPTAPPRTTVEQGVSSELDKPENKTLHDWANYMLGSPGQTDPTGVGAPNPGPIDLPTCLSVTFARCSELLRDAGLTGTITRNTLSQDDAIMEEDADRTTAIYPGGTVQSDTEVTVYVNPATMPTMTAAETTVATQLGQ